MIKLPREAPVAAHPVSAELALMRPEEHEAVHTTIVGGRPPGSGKSVGNIPRGIEILVKKASVDAEFRARLIERRAGAAEEIGLELAPTETALLSAIPADQLEKIIEQTEVPMESRRAFLGKAAVAMVAALGFNLSGCDNGISRSRGVQPDRPRHIVNSLEQYEADMRSSSRSSVEAMPQTSSSFNPGLSKGIRPGRPYHRDASQPSTESRSTLTTDSLLADDRPSTSSKTDSRHE